MSKPVIFLAFANNRDDYLPMINRERKNIYRSLRWFNDNGVIQVETEATTSLADIFEVFTRYDNEIVIFHYAGHADGQQLQLQGDNEEAQSAFAEGLAQLLGRQKNLQLVFLNGCATRLQVDFLLRNGVRAVIATSVSIEDRMATEFAELFYNAISGNSTIERAFQIATAFVSSKYQDFPPVRAFRNIDLEAMADPVGRTADASLPWGLYLNEGAGQVLNWTLPLPVQGYQTSNTENLLNRIPASATEFVGYEQQLDEFEQAIRKYPLIAIEGLGGVGKTEFAIESIRRFIPDRERVIWVSPVTKFDVMVQQAGYEEILRDDQQEESFKFKSFEGLLDRDDRIVFIEDFHDNEDDAYLRFFEQLSIQNSRIVILTRFLPEAVDPGVVIRLEGLGNAALQHARNLRDRKSAYEEIRDEDLEILCRLTEGHPLSLDLGMQLLAYGESANDILTAISSGEYTGHKKLEDLTQRLLRGVLEHGNTSPKERDLLLRFSVFRDRVPLEAIQAISDNPRIKYPLSQLIEKSLIRHRDKLYDLPPLVREFCRSMLKEKELVHELAADYFMDQRSPDFDIYLEENIIYHFSESGQWELLATHIENYGKLFIAHGQVQLLQRIIELLHEQQIRQPRLWLFEAEILVRQGEFKKAKRPLRQALEGFQQQEDIRGVAMLLNVQGELLMGLSNFVEAGEAFTEALELAQSTDLPSVAVVSYQFLALIQVSLGNIDEAQRLAERGLALARELDDTFEVASMLNVQGRILHLQKQYQESLALRQQSYDLFKNIGARSDMVVVANNIAVTLIEMQEYAKALSALETSLQIEKEIGAKYRIGNLYNNLGKTLLQLGKEEEALAKFEECLRINESIKYEFGLAAAHHGIGLCQTAMRNFDTAIRHYTASLSYCEKTGYRLGMITLYKAIGQACENMADPEQALEWYLKAMALSKAIHRPDTLAIKKVDDLRRAIGENRYADRLAGVRRMLPEDIRTALDE